MKKHTALHQHSRHAYSVNTLLLACVFLLILTLAFFRAGAQVKTDVKPVDKALTEEIARQLNSGSLSLKFPASVRRLYAQRQFVPNWIVDQNHADNTWAAMLMMDCVLQYGLNRADYHPGELLYSTLHEILEQPGNVGLTEKARFEIVLTDAVLTFINYLHFGKYNPQYPAGKIDKGVEVFDAASLLQLALTSKDFMLAITTAQPQNKLYQGLQNQMHIVAGVQLGDCYEFPKEDVRKMALNMERLRWAATDTDNYVQVNIPSYQLSFYHGSKTDTFRVVVGKPGNPTPTLQSAIKYFTTSPEWRVPQKIFVKELLPKAIKDTAYLTNNHYSIYNDAGVLISANTLYLKAILKSPGRYRATQSAGCDNALGQLVFRFPNIYDVYLHDTPEPALFYRKARALSHGCVRVQNPKRLAALMLTNDNNSSQIKDMENAIEKGITKNFYLKKPVPVYITYLTCEMKDGVLVKYDDIYNLDKALDGLMYAPDDATLNVANNH
ncbi:L,D-transpeptidase family protein [Mucilaginibacter litoreus]|uniref:L,D-transpeptidase family protein n=1 Tax=Mucilaginibacter litoreus TaxID=1048221 RepID=A0ABW3AXG2_9SPHI